MKKSLLYIGNKLSGHNSTVTSIETLGLLLEKEGYNVYYASSKKNKILRLSEMIFRTIQYRNKVEYVLIDTYSTYNFWYAFIISQLCRFFSLKYIPKLHGGDLPNRLEMNPILSRMIFKYAYINIAPSDYLLEAFKNRGYAHLMCIPNTIEIQNYSFKKRKKCSPKLLWVRSLSDIYNPEMALKVMFEIKKEFSNAKLCMVGPDKDGSKKKLKKIAKQLDLNVVFTGKLSKNKWIKLSEQYDIFLNTTHYDNTPISVIEAIALGLPVISTNVGGIPYLLEHRKTALLVDDNDVNGMVASIKELIENEDLKDKLVINAFNLVQQFDWDLVKNKWLKILI
jgi:glycosyltransferase involved in cell wall biosynthesis